MQEKHPIDERFRALLHDAEVAPPERVRTALASRMGWRTNAAATGTLPFLVVGFLGVALALATWDQGDLHAQQSDAPAVIGKSGHQQGDDLPSVTAHADVPGTAVVNNEHAAALAHHDDTHGNHFPATHAGAPMADGPAATGHAAQVSGHVTPEHSMATPAPVSSGTPETVSVGTITYTVDHASATLTNTVSATSSMPPPFSTPAPVRHPGEESGNTPTATSAPTAVMMSGTAPASATAISSMATLETITLDRLSPITPFDEVGAATPRQAMMPAPYVLPDGEWWWSIGAGISRISATWNGAGADVLAPSEQWRNGRQLGLGVGRSWRNGFSVGLGLNVERIRSDFQHESHTPGSPYTTVDTMWTTLDYPGWSEAVSIWSIDSIAMVGPGSWERTSAQNHYTVLQVPITAWWHADVRRWSFGITAGAMVWAPVQRTGNTLTQEAGDGIWRMTPLDDDILGRRFRPQLHGAAGLSLGYQFSEHLRILAEPMYSIPLYVGAGSPSVALSCTSLQIRLQHALHCR